jgi:hypothetical protein
MVMSELELEDDMVDFTVLGEMGVAVGVVAGDVLSVYTRKV